ncbi:zinc finger BED domain-containing protein RICESLEEPER 2-like [Diachasma alloeum]|uniref:zinc finger BED domain-containing protein RICESLEEPER 2-like n=1 Tax=Diachasma alloeum TaxID=454923 RepID=UPI0007381010|nr:zinc finger BED domain-containing protein RICESLEEPER 2-like [Diachasma alloeum]
MANMFYDSLKKSGLLNKIQGITLDNASVNTVFMKELGKLLGNDGREFDVKNQHFHCFEHVVNLAVQDTFKMLKLEHCADDSIDGMDSEDESTDEEMEENPEESNTNSPIARLRSICKKLKKSEQLKNKLRNCCSAFQEDFIHLPLDVSTRWNSTHDLIAAGLRMQKSISALAQNNATLSHLLIEKEEWIFLGKLGGDRYPTIASVVVGVNILLDSTEALCKSLDDKPGRDKTDENLILAFQAERDKLIKHYNKSNWIYGAVLVLDPRHKLETFDRTQWGKDLKKESYDKFEEIFRTEYAASLDNPPSEGIIPISNDSEMDEYTKALNSIYSTEKKRDWTTEVENYLKLDRENKDVDILEWWSQKEQNFPNLARMARDYLSICGSNVPSERLLSKAGLIIRKHRNRLSNKHIELLLCMNSWFTSELAPKIKLQLLS